MPQRWRNDWGDEGSNLVAQLRSELANARWAIIGLMPEAAQRLLEGFLSCSTRQESYLWRDEVVDQIVGLAEMIPGAVDTFESRRAYCPLCRGGARVVYERGFSVPEGLRRHLIGWGHTRQCDVMKAVMDLAHEHWNEKFRPAEDAEQEQRRLQLLQRRKVETRYCVEPAGEPQLIDEELYGRLARDEAGLSWAEGRLAELGFAVANNADVKSYVSDHTDFVVFADPRGKGEIRFLVYRKPVPTKPARNGRHRPCVGSFFLLDSWKHDIRQKYQSRLDGVISA